MVIILLPDECIENIISKISIYIDSMNYNTLLIIGDFFQLWYPYTCIDYLLSWPPPHLRKLLTFNIQNYPFFLSCISNNYTFKLEIIKPYLSQSPSLLHLPLPQALSFLSCTNYISTHWDDFFKKRISQLQLNWFLIEEVCIFDRSLQPYHIR